MTRHTFALAAGFVLLSAILLILWLALRSGPEATGNQIVAGLCITFLACQFSGLTRHFAKPKPRP